MVHFTPSNLERELSPEEIEKLRLRALENSSEWRDHAALHEKAGMGKARLHLSGEPLFGEEDAVRKRMGLAQKSPQETPLVPKGESVSYNAHTSTTHVYTAPGSQPGLWASCNCGAEFKAEEKGGKLQVTSYGVVGSDSKATGYAVTHTSSYGQTKPSSGYGNVSASETTYG